MIIIRASHTTELEDNLKAIFSYNSKEFQMFIDPIDDYVQQLVWEVQLAIEYRLERVLILN